jgi:transposase
MGKLIEKVKEEPKAKRTRHAKEFKLEAVRLLELGEKSATQLALELGIRRNQLHKWQAELRSKGETKAFRGPGAKPLSEYSEIERLKRELKLITEERDILKKAAAYFAKELA